MPIDPSQHRNAGPAVNKLNQEDIENKSKEEGPELDDEGNPVDQEKFDVDKVDDLKKAQKESDDVKKEDK